MAETRPCACGCDRELRRKRPRLYATRACYLEAMGVLRHEREHELCQAVSKPGVSVSERLVRARAGGTARPGAAGRAGRLGRVGERYVPMDWARPAPPAMRVG